MNSRSLVGWRAWRRLCETCSWRRSWEGSSLPAGDRTARPRALGFLRSGDTNSMVNQWWGHKEHDQSMLCTQRAWPINAMDTRIMTNQCYEHKEHDQSMLWTQTAWPINTMNTRNLTNQWCGYKEYDQPLLWTKGARPVYAVDTRSMTIRCCGQK